MDHAIERLQRIGLKLFVADEAQFEPRELVPIFHRWIQTRALDQLLIDVADYTHLREGPAIVLVAHEGNLALDNHGGRLGLQYYRKQPTDDSLPARLSSICHLVVKAATLLENDPELKERIRFRGEELEFVANDRLLTPNGEEAFEAMGAALEPLLGKLYAGAPTAITRNPDQQERLTLTVKAARPVTLAALADRLTS